MRLLAFLALAFILGGCQVVQKGAQLTADDITSAEAIAVAGGQTLDAQCWARYRAVFSAVEEETAAGRGGVGSGLQVQRDLKALAGYYECYGITVELYTALSRIPYFGGYAIQIFGF